MGKIVRWGANTDRPPRRFGPRLVLAAAVLVVLAAVLFAVRTQWTRLEYDVVIDNATIVDGTGAPTFRGGVGITEGDIVAVWHGRRWGAHARKRRINARGLTLSPGFIDTHSHADFSIGDENGPIRADNFVAQGVTTVIVGNCGRSQPDMRQFRAIVNRRGSNVNIATLAGMNTIRRGVLGDSPAAPDPAQLSRMAADAERAMRAGALGISTGFEYVPGRFATRREVMTLLRVAARHRGVHTSHVRNEGHFVRESVADVIAVSSRVGVPLLISHLKITGRANCAMLPDLESLLRAAPQPVYVDQYPYAASSTDLDIYLPDWFLKENSAGRREVLRNQRQKLKDAVAAHLLSDGFADLSFARVSSFVPRPEWNGRTIRDISLRESGDASVSRQLETMLQIVEGGGAQMVYHNICPDVVERIQRDLKPMIGSDSAIRSDVGRGLPHPRGWGAFAKFLGHSVRKRRVASLPEAIRQMTDLPARFFGISRRGRIEPGYVADLVIFDPRTIGGRASYLRPSLRPTGIVYVCVAGEFVVDQRSAITSSLTDITDAAPGRFIPRNDKLRRDHSGLVASTLR